MSAAVVHLLPRLNGGPISAIAALLEGGGPEVPGSEPLRHEVISLCPVAPAATARLARIGVPVSEAAVSRSNGAELRRRLADAAIVHLHHWNSPELAELLGEELEPMRLVCWSHVNGIEPPQQIPLWLVERAAATVAVSAVTEPALRRRGARGPIELIEPGIDPEVAIRIDELMLATPERGDRVAVAGYVGSLDSAKVHPRIAAMIAQATAGTGARAELCGSGDAAAAIERDAARLGIGDQLRVFGHETDVARRLARLDLFVYPLVAGTYAAAEIALREAMRAGLPAVAIDRGGIGVILTDGITGVVAADEAEFIDELRRLLGDPAERRRLGAAARQAELSRRPSAEAWGEIYGRVLDEPKAAWHPPSDPLTGAAGLVTAIGDRPACFRESLVADPGGSPAEADAAVAVAGPVIARSNGGVLDNRRRAPGDPMLRLWSGLMLADQGRPALAAAELDAAARLGLAERAAPGLDLVKRRALDGLGWIGSGPIVYLGTSVTAQRLGFRPTLHRLLAEAMPGLGREITAGVTELGSLAALFLCDQLVLRHRPSVCFVELAYPDADGFTPPGLVEPAIEALVRRLRAHGCEPCFLLLEPGETSRIRRPEVVAIHRQVAARLGVRVADLTGELRPDDLHDDGVHLSKPGGRRAGSLIADLLRSMAAPDAADSILGHELARTLVYPRLVPANRSDVRDQEAAGDGRLRLIYPYIVAAPGNSFRPALDGTAWGAVIAVGPASGAATVRGAGIRGDSRDERHMVWDRWCTYERLGSVVFENPRVARGGFEFEAAEAEVDRSLLVGVVPDLEEIGQDLRVISWMVAG